MNSGAERCWRQHAARAFAFKFTARSAVTEIAKRRRHPAHVCTRAFERTVASDTMPEILVSPGLSGGSVTVFDGALDALAAFAGTEILALVLRDFIGEFVVFDFLAHPLRVLAAAQVMEPGVVV